MVQLWRRNADDDASLVRRALGGDADAKHLIYERYVRYLGAICSRYLSDDEDVSDVLQNAFLKIFASLDDFRYRGQGSLKAWMGRIVLNESLKFLRDSRRERLVDLTGVDESGLQDAPEDEDLRSDDIPAAEIHRFIRELPDGYRTVFNLYVIEGVSHRDIASRLGIGESSSASQLHRAKAMLASKIRRWHLDNGGETPKKPQNNER